jgi:hypothetical protein
MKSLTKKGMKKTSYTPENVGGGCMTGRVMTEAETKKVSSFIIDYKADKKLTSPNAKPKS